MSYRWYARLPFAPRGEDYIYYPFGRTKGYIDPHFPSELDIPCPVMGILL